jgi:hypothetical protein
MVGLVVSLNPSSRMARTIPVDVRGTLYSEEENKRV